MSRARSIPTCRGPANLPKLTYADQVVGPAKPSAVKTAQVVEMIAANSTRAMVLLTEQGRLDVVAKAVSHATKERQAQSSKRMKMGAMVALLAAMVQTASYDEMPVPSAMTHNLGKPYLKRTIFKTGPNRSKHDFLRLSSGMDKAWLCFQVLSTPPMYYWGERFVAKRLIFSIGG